MRGFVDMAWRHTYGPRVDLLMRGVALSIVLFAWKAYNTATWEEMTGPGALWLHGLCGVSATILLLGPRPLLLWASGLLAIRCMVSNHLPDEPMLWFQAVEWPLYVVVPLTTAWLARERDVVASFRVAGAVAMGFAGFHKLNTDFFEPDVTCNVLADRLTAWWGIPPMVHAWVTPGVIVAMELSLPLFLWWRPRLGMLFACALLAQFVGIGASALSIVVFVCSLSFLDEEDHLALRAVGPRLLVWAIPAVALSGLLYRGPWSWPQYGFSHGVIGGVAVVLVLRLARSGRGRPAQLFAGRSAWIGVLAVLWCLNCLAPYSGLKFQYSFSMLANLRVDDARHNSLVFPRWMRLTEHDPYVHVTGASYWRDGRRLTGGWVQPGLYTPYELRKQARIAAEVGEELVIVGTYRGRPVDLAQALTLPPAHLFQRQLALEGPQPCMH